MAEGLKPYNPNKGFISFRLNPDEIKEELISMIPYNRTIRNIYNNPEGDIRETAKIAVSETPFIGSLLAGEPTNAAKEAFLLGAPIKAPVAVKKSLMKEFKPGTEFGLSVTPNGPRELAAKEPHSKKYVIFDILDDGSLMEKYEFKASDFKNDIQGKPTDINGLMASIEHTNAMFDKVPEVRDKNAVMFANEDIGMPNRSTNNTNLYTGRNETYNSLGNKIQEYDNIRNMYDDVANTKLRKGQSLKVYMPKVATEFDTPELVVTNPSQKKYRYLGYDEWYNVPKGSKLRDMPDKNVFDSDYKALQNDINVRNSRIDFDDYVVPYKNFKQYRDDYINALNEYRDAIYGPFIEDILGWDR